MTNAEYDFDKVSTEERPLIIMGGHKYRLRYPTVEDIEEVQKIKDQQEQNESFYQFIEPTEGAPAFKEVLRKQDLRVLKAFLSMMKKEFGVEE